MAREKEYLYEIETLAPNGRTIKPHIAYRPDRYTPWTVDIDWNEISPMYRDIGHAQAFLRKHYGSQGTAMHYVQKSILLGRLHVLPCDR